MTEEATSPATQALGEGADAPVRLEGAWKRFGPVEAVRGLDLALRPGEVFGLLGPNGAGKTTTIDMILGLTPPSAGSVRIFGLDPRRRSLAVRRLVGVVMQQSALDVYLTGRENLRIYADLFLLDAREKRARVDEALAWAGLSRSAARLVRTYSGGMRRRLDLAIGRLHRPRLMLLDEPTLGLDIHTRRDVWELIRDLPGQGTTVLLTTHYLEEADRLCDRVGIIDHGALVALDTPEELRRQVVGDLHRLRVRCAPGAALGSLASLELPLTPALTDDGLVVSGPPALLWRSLARLQEALAEDILEVRYSAPTLDDVFLRLTVAESGGGTES